MENQEIYKIKLDEIHQRFMSLKLYMKSYEIAAEDFQNELVEIKHIINEILIQCGKDTKIKNIIFGNSYKCKTTAVSSKQRLLKILIIF